MWDDLRAHPSALGVALGLHVVVALVFGLTLQFSRTPSPTLVVPSEIVEAVAIDGAAFDQARREREQVKERERQAVIEARRREEQARREAELQRQREAEAKRQAELARQEKQRQDQLRQEQARKEEVRKEEAERQRLAKLKAEEERRKRAEFEAEQALLQKRMAEEEARLEGERKAAEAKRAAEEAQRRAAEEEARRAARSRELARLVDQYQAAIKAKVEGAWLRPSGERPGQRALVLVEQTPGGYIQNVQILQCVGSEAFCRSVEQAVRRAEPLPTPPSADVFQREIRFEFNPDRT